MFALLPRAVNMVPNPEISSFDLSLCSGEEQAFIRGCQYLIDGREERARRMFARAARRDPTFHDAWFMYGFMELLSGRAEEARQALLHILQEEKPFHGFYVVRFLPTFRAHVNLFEDFLFHVMPVTPEVAAATSRLYLIEGRNREAKKIIHRAFMEYPNNSAVQVVWAQSMIADDAPVEVIEQIDRKISYHKGNTELDILVTQVIGQAFFKAGDFRSGIFHWEGLLHHSQGKNPRLIDRIRILTARAFESKGYLLDTLEVLGTVEDATMPYSEGESVDYKRGRLVEVINTQLRVGIIRPLKFHEEHEYPRFDTTQGFLELHRKGEAGAH